MTFEFVGVYASQCEINGPVSSLIFGIVLWWVLNNTSVSGLWF